MNMLFSSVKYDFIKHYVILPYKELRNAVFVYNNYRLH